MEKYKLYKILDEMREIIGTRETLEALVKAMSSKEFEENLKYIDRCYDLHLFEKYKN